MPNDTRISLDLNASSLFITLRRADMPELARRIIPVASEYWESVQDRATAIEAAIIAAGVEVPECIPSFRCGLAALSYDRPAPLPASAGTEERCLKCRLTRAEAGVVCGPSSGTSWAHQWPSAPIADAPKSRASATFRYCTATVTRASVSIPNQYSGEVTYATGPCGNALPCAEHPLRPKPADPIEPVAHCAVPVPCCTHGSREPHCGVTGVLPIACGNTLPCADHPLRTKPADPIEPAEIIHASTTPWVARCGADYPGMHTTSIERIVTCPQCQPASVATDTKEADTAPDAPAPNVERCLRCNQPYDAEVHRWYNKGGAGRNAHVNGIARHPLVLSAPVPPAEPEDEYDGHPESCRDCDCRHFSIGLSGKAIGCECECHGPVEPKADEISRWRSGNTAKAQATEPEQSRLVSKAMERFHHVWAERVRHNRGECADACRFCAQAAEPPTPTPDVADLIERIEADPAFGKGWLSWEGRDRFAEIVGEWLAGSGTASAPPVSEGEGPATVHYDGNNGPRPWRVCLFGESTWHEWSAAVAQQRADQVNANYAAWNRRAAPPMDAAAVDVDALTVAAEIADETFRPTLAKRLRAMLTASAPPLDAPPRDMQELAAIFGFTLESRGEGCVDVRRKSDGEFIYSGSPWHAAITAARFHAFPPKPVGAPLDAQAIAEEIADAVVQYVCDSDPADPERPDTLKVSVEILRHFVKESCIERAAGRRS